MTKNTRNEKLSEKEHWDENWENIKLPLVPNPETYGNKKLFKIFHDLLPRNGRFIEVGGAPGSWMVWFKKNMNCEVSSIDYSRVGCDATLRNLKLCKIDGKVHCQDIFDNNLKKESYDIVMSGGLIEHFSKPIEILKMHEVLVKKDGWLVIIVPNLYSLPSRFSMILHDSTHIHFPISLKVLKKYYKELGLNIKFAGYVGGLSPNVVNWAKYESKIALGIKKVLNLGLSSVLGMMRNSETKMLSPHIMIIGQKK